MFSFKEYCDDQIGDRKDRFFLLDKNLLQRLTEEELSIVYIEYADMPLVPSRFVRAWYPREGYYRWHEHWFNTNHSMTLLVHDLDIELKRQPIDERMIKILREALRKAIEREEQKLL